MRVERNQTRRSILALGLVDQSPDQRLMAYVDAIECANGQDGLSAGQLERHGELGKFAG
jgi:hypothetical protein